MSSDFLADSEDLGVEFCPTCQPEVDLFERRADGKVWVVKYHPGGACQPSDRGSADGDSSLRHASLWTGTAGEGESNRVIQGVIR